MAKKDYEEKYTRPDLREQIKEDLKASDKGGKPGQWSARKSQLLVQEYEKQGGGYRQNHKDEAAQSLEEWTEQDWQTEGGKARARQAGKTKRYLPKAVWDRLSEAEKREAERTKEQGSQKGEQYVEWPPAVKRAMEEVGYEPEGEPTQQELYEQAQELDIPGRSKMDKDELLAAVNRAEANKLENQTRQELYDRAQDLNIHGRSQMNKDELIEALRQAEQ